jgi:hypothetical protein
VLSGPSFALEVARGLPTALVAASGDIYYGLWYPIIVALMSVVIGFIFLRDNMERDIESDWK